MAFPWIAESSGPKDLDPATGSPGPTTLLRRLWAIADQAQELFRETDFRVLFEPTRKLFSIGYLVRDGTLDPSSYDLLAPMAT
jgi:cyclic beta-1,2-glucan synthetase